MADMGSTQSPAGANISGGVKACVSHPSGVNISVCRQRVGLATAPSPDGPWRRPDAPIIDAGAPGTWDDLFTTNPSPHVFGAMLLHAQR
jgi:hypothetical protein